jgi:predicted NBD/HSP70 family sugar kinase
MDSTRTTTRDIRRRNRSILLSKLFFDGPLSRLELGQITGLSSATVSTVTAELLEDCLIVEAGQVESAGGRPRVLLRVDPEYGLVVGVDVGETCVTIELFDLAMRKRARVMRTVASHRPDPATIVTEIAAGVKDVLAQSIAAEPTCGVDASQIIGVGIGVPGIVETRRGTPAVHAPTIGWDSVPLADMLTEHGITTPVFLGNGAKTQAQAEMWFGAARGARHAIVALVGSGVGAAIISDGVQYEGTTSSAGEWGHTTLVYGGRQCRCGARGCLEAYVGAEAILERYAAVSGGGAGQSPLAAGTRPDGATDEMTVFAALIDASCVTGPGATASTAAAADVLAETAGYLGAGIGNLINLFNPERVVLGGWAGLALGSVALGQIRAAAQRQALAHPYAQVTIELSELGSDAVALGAATLPLADMLRRGEDPRKA